MRSTVLDLALLIFLPLLHIGDSALASCTSLSGISVDSGNLNFTSVCGGLFTLTSLVQFPGGSSDIGGSYDIPDSVTSLRWDAFCMCMLRSSTF